MPKALRKAPLPLLLPVLLLLSACSSLKPQTGDLSFRLLWDGKADLDLHVIDPGGGHVGVPYIASAAKDPERYAKVMEEMAAGKNPDGKTAGLVDIDCNADVERICRKPIENIFWPEGQAPHGEYQVWVEFFQDTNGGAGDVPFLLEIRRGEKVAERKAGSLSFEKRRSEVLRYSY